jgi:hypothetical protein
VFEQSKTLSYFIVSLKTFEGATKTKKQLMFSCEYHVTWSRDKKRRNI